MNRYWRAVMVAGLTTGVSCSSLAGASVQNGPPANVLSAQDSAEKFALTRGRSLLNEFFAVKLSRLWGVFSPEVRAQWGGFEAFQAFREQGVRQYGQLTTVVRERTFTLGGESFYVRSATFEKAPGQVWAFYVGFRGLRVTTFEIALLRDSGGAPQGSRPALTVEFNA